MERKQCKPEDPAFPLSALGGVTTHMLWSSQPPNILQQLPHREVLAPGDPALLPTEEKIPGLQWWKRLENWYRTRSRSWVSPLSTRAWRKPLHGDQSQARTHCSPLAHPGEGRVLLDRVVQATACPPEGGALPKGAVQALAFEVEEGQVLSSHSPAEVITVEGSGVGLG